MDRNDLRDIGTLLVVFGLLTTGVLWGVGVAVLTRLIWTVTT